MFYDSIIKEIDSDVEHFVQVSGLIDRISEGDKVEFELIEGKKGLNAVNVKVISKPCMFSPSFMRLFSFFLILP